ncbi:MAG: hypothetical protein D6758_12050 [Gammaproteobacteria bacterium]|nr:MAG: hypothetical protein D6758_12050 [Gammaproteobacteria bacterium]
MIQANVVSINPVEIFRQPLAHTRMPHTMKGLSWPADTSWTALLYPGAVQGLHAPGREGDLGIHQLANHQVLLTLTVPRMEFMPFSSKSYVKARCRYVGYVLKELELYREELKGHIAGIHWVSDLVRLLCPLELTKLMYSVNRKLGAAMVMDMPRSVELSGPPPEEGVLPLIHGLGFTDLCFNFVDGEQWTHGTLQDCIGMAGSLGFERLHFRLEHASALDQIMRLTLPASVYMERDHEAARAMLGRYTETRPGYFLLQPVVRKPDALWGLGLGAVSAAGEGVRINTQRLDRYYEALDQGQFPLAV